VNRAEIRVEMTTIVTTREQIKEKIKELGRDSAEGSDGITPKMLKELGASVFEPLEIIFNQSFQSGEVPCE
jgi:hypothetical protein